MEDVIWLRAVERWLIIIAAMLCLWLSTQIKRGTQTSTGSLRWHKYLIELRNVGPNVFFAGFGALILIFALFAKVDDKRVTPNGERHTSYLSAQQKDRASGLAREIAQLQNFSSSVANGTLTATERQALVASMRRLAANQSVLFELVYGEGSRARFDDYTSKCAGDSTGTAQECQAYRAEFGASRLDEMRKFGK